MLNKAVFLVLFFIRIDDADDDDMLINNKIVEHGHGSEILNFQGQSIWNCGFLVSNCRNFRILILHFL